MVGLRLPCTIDKKKQLTPLAIYVDIHITNQRKNVLYLFQSYCELSKFTIYGIKLKRFQIYVCCLYNDTKVGSF